MKKMVSFVTASALILTFGAALSYAADIDSDSRFTKSSADDLVLAFGSKGREADQEKSVEEEGMSTGGTGTDGMGTGGTGTAGGGTWSDEAGNGQAGSGTGGAPESNDANSGSRM